MGSKVTNTLRWRILLPVGLTILVLLVGGLLSTYWISRDQLNAHLEQVEDGLNKVMQTSIDGEVKVLAGLTSVLLEDRGLQGAFLAQSREILLDQAKTYYRLFNRDHNITHMYFHRADRTVFLRAHKPTRFDDVISRTTLIRAVKTNRPVHGLELGVFGSYVLRYVHPWVVKGELVGYIELGKEVDYIASQAARVMGVEALMFIRKDLLNRKTLQAYYDYRHKHLHWDDFKWVLLTEHSIELHGQNLKNINLTSLQQRQPVRIEDPEAGRQLYGSSIKRTDINENEVGYLVYLSDVSHILSELKQTMLVLIVLGVSVFVVIVSLFYRYLGRVEFSITDVQSKLQNEVEEHRQTEKDLLQNKRELESSNRELESYSYSIAHDLRAPLRSIVSFAQILTDDARERLTDDDKSHLERVTSAGRYMSKLIDDILDLARVSRRELVPVDVDAGKLVKELHKRYLEAYPQRRIDLVLEDDMSIRADRVLLERLLDNLLSNAFKYTVNRELAVVEIGIDQQVDEKIYFVRDNGIGLDMAYADKIFMPFQRLSAADRYKGSGVGLAIVHRIVARHHGRIWVESELDKGTTLFFTLKV